MIVRIFGTAIHPDDIEQAKDLFRADVRPAFEAFDGCAGIEMCIGVGEHSGELVEVAAISRWDSIEAMETGIATNEYVVAMTELRQLFAQAPIVRLFESVD
ncbi:MAG: hypothetical protein GEU71_03300 [Actinobacteria bacterium]|jgi:quinol monooxygenase YgiN|nr:hypothetical protein [Actinomycetota bacterium]